MVEKPCEIFSALLDRGETMSSKKLAKKLRSLRDSTTTEIY